MNARSRHLVTLVLVLSVGLLGACTSAVVSDTQLSAGQPRAGHRVTALGVGSSKAEVLEALGPPAEIMAPFSGDLFVYRLAHVDQQLVQLNPNLLGGPSLPLWADYEGFSRDETVLVFFDETGRVTQLARRVIRRDLEGDAR